MLRVYRLPPRHPRLRRDGRPSVGVEVAAATRLRPIYEVLKTKGPRTGRKSLTHFFGGTEAVSRVGQHICESTAPRQPTAVPGTYHKSAHFRVQHSQYVCTMRSKVHLVHKLLRYVCTSYIRVSVVTLYRNSSGMGGR